MRTFSSFLVIAPFKIFQLRHAKLVTLPNHRGLIKAASEVKSTQNISSDTLEGSVCYAHCFAANIHYFYDHRAIHSSSSSCTSIVSDSLCSLFRAIISRTWPFHHNIHALDRVPVLLHALRCHPVWASVRSPGSKLLLSTAVCHRHCQTCSPHLRDAEQDINSARTLPRSGSRGSSWIIRDCFLLVG